MYHSQLSMQGKKIYWFATTVWCRIEESNSWRFSSCYEIILLKSYKQPKHIIDITTDKDSWNLFCFYSRTINIIISFQREEYALETTEDKHRSRKSQYNSFFWHMLLPLVGNLRGEKRKLMGAYELWLSLASQHVFLPP